MTTLISDMIDAAIKIASKGYSIFLLKDYGDADKRKTPLNNGWQIEASTDLDTIKKRFEQHPDSNYGIKLGPHDIALDFDDVSELKFEELRKRLHNEIGFNGETFIQRTASERGYHELLRLPDGIEIKNNPRLYRQGETTVELRSNGYYIVGPYSHIGNAVYTPLTLFDVAELTPEQCEKLARLSDGQRNETRTFDFGHDDKIPKGSRHTTLMKLAGDLRRKGLGYKSILRMLEVANQENCVEKIPSYELKDIASYVADKDPAMSIVDMARGFVPRTKLKDTGEASDGEEIDLSAMDTQMGVAEWFAHKYHDKVSYCAKWKKWLAFDEKHWLVGADGADVYIQFYIKNRAKEIYRELADPKNRCSLDDQKELSALARRCQQTFFIRGVLDFAKNEQELQIKPEELNANKWLFNVSDGTIELHTRTIREHRAEDYITYVAPVTYDPDAHSDVFENYITRVMPDMRGDNRFNRSRLSE